MIRVALLDRQPTVRTGVAAILMAEPDLELVGTAATQKELCALLSRTRPDVVLLDHRLLLCLRIKARPGSPRVLICAADPGSETIVPATLAGADGIVDTAADVRDLLSAIRAVAAGERVVPRISPRLQAEAAARLEPRDRPIFAMRLAGTTPSDIAAVVGVGLRELEARTAAIVAALSGRGSLQPA